MAPQGPAAARWASPRPPAAVAVSALAFALGLLLLAAAPAGAQVPAARPAAAAAMDNIKNVTCIVKKGSGDLANVKWANDAGKGGYMIKKGATETTSGFDSYTLSFLDSSISSTNLGYSKKPTPSWYLGFTTANGVYKYCGKMDKTAVPWASKADAPKLHASSSKKPGLALEKLGGGGCDKKTGVCKKAQTKYGGAMVLHDNDIRSQCKPSTIYVVYQRFMGATCYDMQQATENPRQTVSDLFMANYYTDFSWFCYKMPVGTGFCAPVLKCPSGWSLQLYSKSMGYCSDIWSKYKIKLEEFDAANAWTVASYMCTNLKDGETHLCLPNSVYCPDGTHQTSYTSSMGLCYQFWQAAGITKEQFAAANPGMDVDAWCGALQEGQQFCMPSPQTTCPLGSQQITWVPSMGYCYDIWTKYGITQVDFEKYNPDWQAKCGALQEGKTTFCIPTAGSGAPLVLGAPPPGLAAPTNNIFMFYSGSYAFNTPPALANLPTTPGVNIFLAAAFAWDRTQGSDPSNGNYDWYTAYKDKGGPYAYQPWEIQTFKSAAQPGTTRKALITINGDLMPWQPQRDIDKWVANAASSLGRMMDAYGMDGIVDNMENVPNSQGYAEAKCKLYRKLKQEKGAIIIMDTYEGVDSYTKQAWDQCKDVIDFLAYQTYGGAAENMRDLGQWVNWVNGRIDNVWGGGDAWNKLLFSFSSARGGDNGDTTCERGKQRGIIDIQQVSDGTKALMAKGAAGAFVWAAEWSANCQAWSPRFAMESAIQNTIAGGGPAPPPPPPTPTNLCTKYYTVAPGEGCWQIADAASPKLTPCCDAATSPFMKLNPYLRCDATSPAAGDKLCVRGCAKTYTVQAGDNCFQIATNNQVTYNPDFINMNPNLGADAGTCTIKPGDIVCVALPTA